MRPAIALVVSLTFLPAFAWAGYPYDENDDNDYVTDNQEYPPEDAASAEAYYDPNTSIGYYGPHPIPYENGSGFCYIEGAHTHDYAPFDQNLFREYNGYYYFIGDPVDFGWTRTTYWYNANHPIPTIYGGGYCYLYWPHRHWWQPTSLLGFNLVNGSWWYTGAWPTDYWTYRNYYWGYYQNYYRHNYYGNHYYTGHPRPVYRVHRPYRVPAPAGRVFVSAPPPAKRYNYPTARGIGNGVRPPPRIVPARGGFSGGFNGGRSFGSPPPAAIPQRAPVPASSYGGPPRVYTPPPAQVYTPPRVYTPPPAQVYTPPRVHTPPAAFPSGGAGFGRGGFQAAPPPAAFHPAPVRSFSPPPAVRR